MLKPCLISFEAETVEYLYALIGEGTVKTIDVLAKLDPELRSVSKQG